jgi:hypothetical protein
MKLLHLIVRRLGELFSPMSCVGQEEARQAIDITLPLVVEDVATLSPHDDGQSRGAALLGKATPEMLSRELLELLGCLCHDPSPSRSVVERAFDIIASCGDASKPSYYSG